MTSTHPRILLKPGVHKRLRAGQPWIYSNEVNMDAAAKALPPGSIVTIDDAGGTGLFTAHFNPKTLISARLLDAKPHAQIGVDWFVQRLQRAMALRARLGVGDHYRWVHAEGDNLPGLVIDRFADAVVVQPNTAGMDRALPDIFAAIDAVASPTTMVVRADSTYRALEGLGDTTRVERGTLSGPVEVRENGLRYFADLTGGQKTGWFFDQRDNRAFVASFAKGAAVVDLYTHTGGFALACAAAGAANVVAVDGSAAALELAAQSAKANNLSKTCVFERADVFDYLAAATARKDKFDVVIADPPAFVKSRKDLKPGLQGYRKLARLCAQLTARGGTLFIASCSHNAPLADFTDAVARGVNDANRSGRILRTSGAAADHPVHLHLPETAYLKALTVALD